MKLVKDINKESPGKPQVSDKEVEEAVKKILTWIGEDPTREGLIETPKISLIFSGLTISG